MRPDYENNSFDEVSLEKVAFETKLLRDPIVSVSDSGIVWTNGGIIAINDPNMRRVLKGSGQNHGPGLYSFSFDKGMVHGSETNHDQIRDVNKSIAASYDTLQRVEKPSLQLMDLLVDNTDQIATELESKMEASGLDPLTLTSTAVYRIGKDKYRITHPLVNEYFTRSVFDPERGQVSPFADTMVSINKKNSKMDIYRKGDAIVGASILTYNERVR